MVIPVPLDCSGLAVRVGSVDLQDAGADWRFPIIAGHYVFDRRSGADVRPLPLAGAPTLDHDHDPKRFLCAACAHYITDVKSHILRDGAHQHTFINPLGLVFVIGCFSMAPGCLEVGREMEDCSWFAGFVWRVAICTGCHVHLGWQYGSDGKDQFYGLIVDRLQLTR